MAQIARARTQFFRLFEHKQEKSEQRATNFSNISLRFLKRSRSTKSTRCELNRINSSSVHIKTFAFSDEYTPLESWTTKTLYQSIWAFLGMDADFSCKTQCEIFWVTLYLNPISDSSFYCKLFRPTLLQDSH